MMMCPIPYAEMVKVGGQYLHGCQCSIEGIPEWIFILFIIEWQTNQAKFFTINR